MTSFPDRKAWGVKACTPGQGSAEPTLCPQKSVTYATKHLVCAKGRVGLWGPGGNRLDKLPALLALTLLWEIRGDTISQWRGREY